jgi:hypothetical protein
MKVAESLLTLTTSLYAHIIGDRAERPSAASFHRTLLDKPSADNGRDVTACGSVASISAAST